MPLPRRGAQKHYSHPDNTTLAHLIPPRLMQAGGRRVPGRLAVLPDGKNKPPAPSTRRGCGGAGSSLRGGNPLPLGCGGNFHGRGVLGVGWLVRVSLAAVLRLAGLFFLPLFYLASCILRSFVLYCVCCWATRVWPSALFFVGFLAVCGLPLRFLGCWWCVVAFLAVLSRFSRFSGVPGAPVVRPLAGGVVCVSFCPSACGCSLPALRRFAARRGLFLAFGSSAASALVFLGACPAAVAAAAGRVFGPGPVVVWGR